MYIHLIMGRIPNLVMKRQYTGTKLSCFMTFCSWFLSFFFEPDLILHYPRPFSKYTNSQAPHPCPKMSLTIDLKKIMKVHVTAAWNWYLQGTATGSSLHPALSLLRCCEWYGTCCWRWRWTMLFRCRQKPASKYSNAVRLWMLEIAYAVTLLDLLDVLVKYAGHWECSR